MAAATDFGPDVASGVFRDTDDETSRTAGLATDSPKCTAIVAVQVVVDSTPEPAEAVFEQGKKTGHFRVGANSADAAVLEKLQAVGPEPHRVVVPSSNCVDASSPQALARRKGGGVGGMKIVQASGGGHPDAILAILIEFID